MSSYGYCPNKSFSNFLSSSPQWLAITCCWLLLTAMGHRSQLVQMTRSFLSTIARFRYFKIQLETKDITTRLRGINHINLLYHSPKPHSGVFCFKLNFIISQLGYCNDIILNLLAFYHYCCSLIGYSTHYPVEESE